MKKKISLIGMIVITQFLSACSDQVKITDFSLDPTLSSISPITNDNVSFSFVGDLSSRKIDYACASNTYPTNVGEMIFKQISAVTKKMFPNSVYQGNSPKEIVIKIDAMSRNIDGNLGFGKYRVDLGSQIAGTVTLKEKSGTSKSIDISSFYVSSIDNTNCWSLKNQVENTAKMSVLKLSRDYYEKISQYFLEKGK